MKKGFSLIELMVVVVIIGILATIAIPNFIRLKDRAKESEVKSNVHTIHLAVEAYCTSNDGLYCMESANLVDDLDLPSTMKNPFGGANAVVINAPVNDGEVGYDHDGYDGDPYTILGMGKDGKIILKINPGY